MIAMVSPVRSGSSSALAGARTAPWEPARREVRPARV